MDAAQQITNLWESWKDCRKCGELCRTRNSVVFGDGNPYAQIVIVGEAPGENEDETGLPFVGPAGQLLDRYLGSTHHDPDVREIAENPTSYNAETLREYLKASYFYTNVLACRPPDNRDPNTAEIKACLPRLRDIIYTIDPVYILTVGGTALEAMLGKKKSILLHHGDLIDVSFKGKMHDITYPVMPILHTSYLLRKADFSEANGECGRTYRHVLKLMHLLDRYNQKHYGVAPPAGRPQIES